MVSSMVTRSNIGMDMGDGTVRWVYCHSDGYPSHVGRILHKSFVDREEVERLLAHGDISSLGEGLDDEETVFYHRDRGEPKETVQAKILPKEAFGEEEYTYLWGDGVWMVRSHNRDWMTIPDAILDELQE